jgi:putative transposase
MLEITKCAPQLAIMQLGEGFKNFFAKRAKYPVFRKKGVHDRFSLSNDQFSVEDKSIHIPKLGWVRMCEALRFEGKIMSATISRVADRWFVSITVDVEEHPHLPEAENQGSVGVDFGVHALATFSTGEPPVLGPKPHKALLKRLARCSQSLPVRERIKMLTISDPDRNKITLPRDRSNSPARPPFDRSNSPALIFINNSAAIF